MDYSFINKNTRGHKTEIVFERVFANSREENTSG